MAGKKRRHKVDVVRWKGGAAVYLNEERIAGPKPPSGSRIILTLPGDREQTLRALAQGETLKSRRVR